MSTLSKLPKNLEIAGTRRISLKIGYYCYWNTDEEFLAELSELHNDYAKLNVSHRVLMDICSSKMRLEWLGLEQAQLDRIDFFLAKTKNYADKYKLPEDGVQDLLFSVSTESPFLMNSICLIAEGLETVKLSVFNPFIDNEDEIIKDFRTKVEAVKTEALVSRQYEKTSFLSAEAMPCLYLRAKLGTAWTYVEIAKFTGECKHIPTDICNCEDRLHKAVNRMAKLIGISLD